MQTHCCEKCKKCVAKSHETDYNGVNSKNRRDADVDKKAMEYDSIGPIQRYYYEDMMARRDTEVDRWHTAWKNTFVALVVMTCLFIASWIGFIIYEQQFEDITMTQEAQSEGDGDITINGVASGDFYYGESEADDQGPEA